MKPKYIAKKIRELRESSRLSQQDIAKQMGWKSHTSLVSIENGEREVKTWELLKLAEILKVSPEALYNENYSKPPTHPIIFWRKMATDAKAVLEEEHNIIQHCQDYRLVERLVGTISIPNKALPNESCDIRSVDTAWANQLADKMHRELNLGDYPAELLSKRLEEEYGVLLIVRPLENGSAACYREEFVSAIVLNEKEISWRQSFNLAHELFHLITWSTSLIEQVKNNEALFKKNELLADTFAAALLMPQQMISLDVKDNKLSYSFIVALARKYRVSTQAMLWRLFHLRFISKESIDRALSDEEFKKLDRSTFKNGFQITTMTTRFLRLAYLAYEQGRLSKSRLAQMLGVKLRDVYEYLSEKGFYLTNGAKIEATYLS